MVPECHPHTSFVLGFSSFYSQVDHHVGSMFDRVLFHAMPTHHIDVNPLWHCASPEPIFCNS